MTRRILNLLIAIDQMLYVLLTLGHGSPDETLSAACWRWEQAGRPQGRLLRPLVDAVMLLITLGHDRHHCFKAFCAELRRHQLPAAYRAGL